MTSHTDPPNDPTTTSELYLARSGDCLSFNGRLTTGERPDAALSDWSQCPYWPLTVQRVNAEDREYVSTWSDHNRGKAWSVSPTAYTVTEELSPETLFGDIYPLLDRTLIALTDLTVAQGHALAHHQERLELLLMTATDLADRHGRLSATRYAEEAILRPVHPSSDALARAHQIAQETGTPLRLIFLSMSSPLEKWARAGLLSGGMLRPYAMRAVTAGLVVYDLLSAPARQLLNDVLTVVLGQAPAAAEPLAVLRSHPRGEPFVTSVEGAGAVTKTMMSTEGLLAVVEHGPLHIQYEEPRPATSAPSPRGAKPSAASRRNQKRRRAREARRTNRSR